MDPLLIPRVAQRSPKSSIPPSWKGKYWPRSRRILSLRKMRWGCGKRMLSRLMGIYSASNSSPPLHELLSKRTEAGPVITEKIYTEGRVRWRLCRECAIRFRAAGRDLAKLNNMYHGLRPPTFRRPATKKVRRADWPFLQFGFFHSFSSIFTQEKQTISWLFLHLSLVSASPLLIFLCL